MRATHWVLSPNEMFLVYVAFFAASLFAFVTTFASVPGRGRGCVADLPRRGPGWFMVISGVMVLAMWLMDPIGGLIEGGPPRGVDTYTTLFTHAFDMAIIAPAAIAAGVMILKRHGTGYVTAFSLLVLVVAPCCGWSSVTRTDLIIGVL